MTTEAYAKFLSLHNARKQDKLRLGQRFCNMYVKESWPSLYYTEDETLAKALINGWLANYHYYNALPPEIKR
jgi:hypothetical protein